MKPRQNNNEWGSEDRSWIIVNPVVVNPLVDSKKAFKGFKLIPKMKGNPPINDTTTQAIPTINILFVKSKVMFFVLNL